MASPDDLCVAAADRPSDGCRGRMDDQQIDVGKGCEQHQGSVGDGAHPPGCDGKHEGVASADRLSAAVRQADDDRAVAHDDGDPVAGRPAERGQDVRALIWPDELSRAIAVPGYGGRQEPAPAGMRVVRVAAAGGRSPTGAGAGRGRGRAAGISAAMGRSGGQSGGGTRLMVATTGCGRPRLYRTGDPRLMDRDARVRGCHRTGSLPVDIHSG